MHVSSFLLGPDAPWRQQGRRNESIRSSLAKAGRDVEDSAPGAAASAPEAPLVPKAPGLPMVHGGLSVESGGDGGSATMEPPMASDPVRAEAMAPPPPRPASEMSSGSSVTGPAAPKLPPMPTIPGGRVKAAPPPPPGTVLLRSWIARE